VSHHKHLHKLVSSNKESLENIVGKEVVDNIMNFPYIELSASLANAPDMVTLVARFNATKVLHSKPLLDASKFKPVASTKYLKSSSHLDDEFRLNRVNKPTCDEAKEKLFDLK